MGNFSRMKLQCTIAISKLVGTTSIFDFENLRKSMLAISKRAKQKHPKEASLGFVFQKKVTLTFVVHKWKKW